MEKSLKISAKDSFCDYTSISGVRFLHSRHPLWFRQLSAFVLIVAVLLFFIHIRVFIQKLISNQKSITSSTQLSDSIIYPRIIISSLAPIKSCIFYDGTDCMSLLSYDTVLNRTLIDAGSQDEEKSIFDLINSIVIEVDIHFSDVHESVNVSIVANTEKNAVVLPLYENRELSVNVFEYVCVEDDEISRKCISGYYSIDDCYLYLGENVSALITFRFNNGIRHVQGWRNSYPTYVFMIDIGSSLGLYFGLTFLTLFEVVVFFFYGSEIELQSLSPPPTKAVIYDFPSKKLLERRTKDAKRKIQVQTQKIKISAMNLPPIF